MRVLFAVEWYQKVQKLQESYEYVRTCVAQLDSRVFVPIYWITYMYAHLHYHGHPDSVHTYIHAYPYIHKCIMRSTSMIINAGMQTFLIFTHTHTHIHTHLTHTHSLTHSRFGTHQSAKSHIHTETHAHTLSHIKTNACISCICPTRMSQEQDMTKSSSTSAASMKACPDHRDDGRQLDAPVAAAVAAVSFQNWRSDGGDASSSSTVSHDVEVAIAQMTQDGGNQKTQSKACYMLWKLACDADSAAQYGDCRQGRC
jgi:hypothetical protein